MLIQSVFGEDLFDDFMGYPAGRQAAANAYPQVKDMMKTDIRDVDGNYELEIDLPGFKKEDVKIQLKNVYRTFRQPKKRKGTRKMIKVNMFAENVIQEPATEAFM